MDSNAASPLTDRRIWVRILYMLFFWLAYSIAELLIAIVAIFQAGATVFTGHTNDAAHRFGKNLTVYATHIFEFVTFNSEHLPFPFADWPDEEPTPTPWMRTTTVDVDTSPLAPETVESDEQPPTPNDTPPRMDESP